ncbi:MAG: hypothetical protein Q8L35_07235 [Actinomycetota bacterium]|nr:hypothetical protein [Actinomycetota bacterium]
MVVCIAIWLLAVSFMLLCRAKLTVQKRLDGSFHLIYSDRELEFVEISKEAQSQPVVEQEKPKKSMARMPAPDHPWRHPKWGKQLIGAAP